MNLTLSESMKGKRKVASGITRINQSFNLFIWFMIKA